MLHFVVGTKRFLLITSPEYNIDETAKQKWFVQSSKALYSSGAGGNISSVGS